MTALETGSRPHVRLVDADGADLGIYPVHAAHRDTGMLHRAFSVVLYDGRGRVLMQRRADVKTRWPGYVANSCCGHPDRAESVIDDATQRLWEELGVRDVPLTEVGRFAYEARMPGSPWVEREYDHVLVGLLEGEPKLDPAEVSEVFWCDVDDWARRGPVVPWLGEVMGLVAPSCSAARQVRDQGDG